MPVPQQHSGAVAGGRSVADSGDVKGLWWPCTVCGPTAPVELFGEASLVRCSLCGTEHPIERKPLYLVTGAPATGKSAVVRHLVRSVRGLPVFDTDLFGPSSNPDWAAWATSWLLVAHGLAQAGMSTVLCGYGISRTKAEALPARALLGRIRVCNLNLRAELLRARLHRRGGYDAARIERKVDAGKALQAEADENIDVSDEPPVVVGARVLDWLQREQAIPREPGSS